MFNSQIVLFPIPSAPQKLLNSHLSFRFVLPNSFICIHEHGQSIYIRTVSSQPLFILVSLIPFQLIWTENECLMHVALTKRPINQFQPVWQSRQQSLRAYYPNVYTVIMDNMDSRFKRCCPQCSDKNVTTLFKF